MTSVTRIADELRKHQKEHLLYRTIYRNILEVMTDHG